MSLYIELKKFFLDKMIRKYVHKILKTHFVIDENDYELKRIPPWLGTSKFFLKIRNESVVARFYPITKRLAAKRFIKASHLIEKNGFPPIPKIIYFDLTLKTLLRYGLSVIVVEKIEGEGYEKFKGDRDVLLNIAQGLASINGIHSQRMGEIWNLHKKDCYLYLMRKVREFLVRVNRHFISLRKEKKVIFEWFQKWCKRLDNNKEFNLSRPSFTADDIIIDETKKVYFSDLDDVLFGTFGFDLTWALFNFCTNPEERMFFKKIYFNQLPERYKRHWDTYENFYYAWYCLANVAGWIGKAVMMKEKDRDSYLKFRQEATNLWQEMTQYISK